MKSGRVIFATYLESADGLPIVHRLRQSLKTFGGKFADSPLRVYMRQDIKLDDTPLVEQLESEGVAFISSRAPESSMWLFYANKVYAAADAETEAEDESQLLVWIDDDSVILSEPIDFPLDDAISLAYVPVMHNRSGALYDTPPDAFWNRIYEILSVTDDMLFPMTTPADNQKIKAYFHAGLMVVRPEKGILRQWAKDFELLSSDSALAEMCRVDTTKRVFLHQTALVGLLHNISRDEMVELSGRYNYPIFFERQYGADQPFDSIENAVTIRCLVSPENLGPNWPNDLKGPKEKIAWLTKYL